RHLVRIEVVEASLDALLLGQAGKLVVIEVPGNATVLTAVAGGLLGWLAFVLVGHHITTRLAWLLAQAYTLRPTPKLGQSPHAPAPGARNYRRAPARPRSAVPRRWAANAAAAESARGTGRCPGRCRC